MSAIPLPTLSLLFRGLFGPGDGWARHAARVLGLHRNTVYRIVRGEISLTPRTMAILSNYAVRRPELLDAELDRALKSEAARITAYYAKARVQALSARIALAGVMNGRERHNTPRLTPIQRRRQSDPISSSVPLKFRRWERSGW
jgi:plasmid maintenance system antidote protein VapI